MTQSPGPGPWPSELKVPAAKNELRITFLDGVRAVLSAEFLRISSPSAEVRGHSPATRQLQPGKKHVLITAVEPVGNYAVRIVFSDGHNTGIYSWTYFYELARDEKALWQKYLAELEEAGLSRE